MQRTNPASLRRALSAHGGASRLIVGEGAVACWSELASGSVLDEPEADLRGRTVLLAAMDPFAAAALMIQLDGTARRIVLCPPDLSREHLGYVARTAGAEMIVTDEPLPAEADAAGCAVLRCGRKLAPIGIDGGGQAETEWILLTSGTTGAPKLVQHTLATLSGAIDACDGRGNVWSTFYDIRRYGGLQIFLRAVLTGASLLVRDAGQELVDFLVWAGKCGVNQINGTPSHWRKVMISGAADRFAPEYVRLSGEIADQGVLNQLRAQYPQAKISHAFASTEAGVVFEVDDGRMGFRQAILDGSRPVEMKVVGGTLRVRSGRTAIRYLGEGSPVLKDAEGFVDTGDSLDLRDGRYYFAGRRDGVINVGGNKVHPEEVEAVINRHPAVSMSLVQAKRNAITGALVVAQVVLRERAAEESPAEQGRAILEFCRGELAAYKVPVQINVVSSLAVGEAGKLARRA